MFLKLDRRLFDNATGGDEPPSGAGGDDPPATPPAGDPPPPAPVSAFRPPEGGDGTPPAGDPPPTGDPPADGRPEWAPQKFWDPEGKALKTEELAKSYAELERRFRGAVDLPPKDAEGYEFQKRDGETFELDPELDAAFRDAALEMGLNNRQYNDLVREHVDGVRDAVAGVWAANEHRTIAELKEQHGDKADAVRADAWNVAQKYLTPEELQALERAPSSAVVMNLLARIAPELKADRAPAGSPPADSFETMTKEAVALRREKGGKYWDATKPGHAEAVAKVLAWEQECARRGVNSRELLLVN